MNIFFRKKLSEADLREFLISKNQKKWNRIKKFFINKLSLEDVNSSPPIYFHQLLKTPNQQKTAFENAFEKLQKNAIPENQSILNAFERHLDFELIKLVKSNDAKIIKQTENYLFFRFSKLCDLQKFKKLIPNKEERDAAFVDAFINFLKNIQTKPFEHQATLKTYFNVFFERKCIDYNRRFTNPMNQVWKGDEEDLLRELNAYTELKNVYSKYDIEELRVILKQFEKINPECYESIALYYLKNIPSEVIAEMNDKTQESIRGKRFRCLKKFRDFWKKNQNR